MTLKLVETGSVKESNLHKFYWVDIENSLSLTSYSFGLKKISWKFLIIYGSILDLYNLGEMLRKNIIL